MYGGPSSSLGGANLLFGFLLPSVVVAMATERHLLPGANAQRHFTTQYVSLQRAVTSTHLDSLHNHHHYHARPRAARYIPSYLRNLADSEFNIMAREKKTQQAADSPVPTLVVTAQQSRFHADATDPSDVASKDVGIAATNQNQLLMFNSSTFELSTSPLATGSYSSIPN